MKSDNRVRRSGGIRRTFDKPPPRLLKIVSSNFFSSGAIIVFRFCAFFPPYALSLNDKVGPHIQLLHHTQSYAVRQIFVIKNTYLSYFSMTKSRQTICCKAYLEILYLGIIELSQSKHL